MVLGLEQRLLRWELWYHEKFIDRALDYKRSNRYDDVYPDHIYDRIPDRWHLSLLGTDEKFQRRGIGRMLLEFGMRMAERDDVPIALESSVAGMSLYKRSGFKVVYKAEVEGDLECVVMAWEPEQSMGEWVEDLGNGEWQVREQS